MAQYIVQGMYSPGISIQEVSDSFEWFDSVNQPAGLEIDGHDVLHFETNQDKDIEFECQPLPGSEDQSLILDFRFRMSSTEAGTVRLRVTPIVDGAALAPIDVSIVPLDQSWKTQSIVVLASGQYTANSALKFKCERRGLSDALDNHGGGFYLQSIRERY